MTAKIIQFKPKRDNQMDILLYTRPGCSKCEKLKAFLKTHAFEYQELNVDEDGRRDRLIEAYPTIKSLPVVSVDGVVIGTADDLYALYEMTKLET